LIAAASQYITHPLYSYFAQLSSSWLSESAVPCQLIFSQLVAIFSALIWASVRHVLSITIVDEL